MKATILLAEDEQAMREVLTDYFTAKSGGDFTVVAAPDGDTALHLIETQRFDLLLLDIMLPGTDGFALCRAAREQGDAPILFVTAREDEQDKLHGYGLGADDYVVKPFSLAVLRARVAVQLRTQRAQEEAVRIGPFHFDFARMVFSREGATVELSKTEQRLLRVLVENRGHAVSRSDLIDRVWSEEAAFVEENALSVTVKRLRAKLERDPAHPQWLRTVRGIGYEWGREP